MSHDPITWIVGAGGLLGSHVLGRFRQVRGRTMTAVVPWHDPDEVGAALRRGVGSLAAAAGRDQWNVAWCAGAGVMATSGDQLDAERRVFHDFLSDLEDALPAGSDGGFFLASSAGGLYAGSSGSPFTEASEVRPLTDYGRVKLAMETDLRAFAERTGTPVLVGRIANLYGPGQNLDKPQGLVSQLCRAQLTGQPLPVFASLDTRRDYLFAGDCADMVVAGLSGIRERVANDPSTIVVKILASGRSTTIGTLVGESTRMFRRRVRVGFGAAPAARQVLDLRFSSTVWPELDRYVRTPFVVGLSATAEDIERRVLQSPNARGAEGFHSG